VRLLLQSTRETTFARKGRTAPAARRTRASPAINSERIGFSSAAAQEAGTKLRVELAALQQAVNPLFLPVATGSPSPATAASASSMTSPTGQTSGGLIDTTAEPATSRTYGLA
jgi:hypothetical protein